MLPSGVSSEFRVLTKEFKAELPEDLVELIEANPPRVISGERALLKSRYGLETRSKASVISKTKRGYTVSWRVDTIGRSNVQRFAERIGFDDHEKQRKLEDYLKRREKRI